MIYKFEFNSKEEKHAIEKNNSDKYLIEEQYLIDGNFLVYTDELSDFEMIQKKISILEAENETLKQELSITQDAVNELIFNFLNM